MRVHEREGVRERGSEREKEGGTENVRAGVTASGTGEELAAPSPGGPPYLVR